MLPPGSRGLHAAACGDVPPPGGGGKRGQDTKVSYPLLRLPNFPLRRSAEHSRLKNEESTDFTSVLSFLFCHGSAIARFAAHNSARPVGLRSFPWMMIFTHLPRTDMRGNHGRSHPQTAAECRGL